MAGEEIKKTVLELGGSDPFVVLPSADLDKAAEVAVTARCQNNGQSCIAAKRFIVHEAVADEFERRFVERMAALRLGDPMDEATDLGPLATEQGRADVEELVDDAVKQGATVLVGGQRPDGPGWFYPATVVTGITRQMRMFAEEVFGPVAQLSTGWPTSTRPSSWPTPRCSASAPTSGPTIRPSRSASCATWWPAPCSSTA